MTRVIIVAVLLLCAGSAAAETWYGFWSRNPYAPWRIQPGFSAPPLPSLLRPCLPWPQCRAHYLRLLESLPAPDK